MTAPAVYMVLAWTSPAGEAPFLAWLDDNHMAEVIAQPGFTGCRRIRLEQRDVEGWAGHMIIYEIESAASLERYLASDIRKAFLAEGKLFEGVRMERFNGEVEVEL